METIRTQAIAEGVAAPRLKRELGLWTATALVIGNMVGSGIFLLPSPSTAAKSPAGGSRSPGLASPSAIARRISAATCLLIDADRAVAVDLAVDRGDR
jgi:hypothetical protein